jgi:hypothetical protein
MCGLISSRLLKKNLYGPIFRIVGDMGVAFGSIYLKLCRKALDKKSPPQSRDGLCYENKSGGVLLSHAVTHVVSSALQGLTTEFGMGSGVAPALWPPETV